ncbi:caspase domain-containing protein [Streptomyces sp. NPDC001914]|uniref:caspase family protein n=1 Tax=Streptomyces sp. NPDC001914 TaxID=3364623 RepID=UPI00368D0422
MTNRALLVGIDEYPNPRNNLNSCVKDTRAFRELLDRYGFTDDDVRFLHNADATLTQVRDGLDWLFDGAEPGDRRVFFESSHGYRDVRDGVMTEVLCLYDAFLEDKELSRRTQGIPDGVLTVVLDACHSGGMEKVFLFGDETLIARNKVFLADPEMAETKAFAVNAHVDSVVPVKFFGRAATDNASAASKNFATASLLAPAAKDMAEPEVELNAVLLTACRADETAAAGSAPTNGLSAFTFALVDQLDTSITVSALCDRVTSRLKALNMRQTPTVFAPSDQQFLLSDTFISEQPVTQPLDLWDELFGGTDPSAGASKSGVFTTDGAGTTHTQTKEFSSMTTIAPDIHGTIESVLGSIAKNAGAAPSNGAATTKDASYLDDVAKCAANLVPAVVAAGQTATASKAPRPRPTLSNPNHLQSKDFWDDVLDVANTVVDVAGPVLSILSKDMAPQGSQAAKTLATQIAPERLHDKDFWSSAFGALETIVPHLINAAAGKGFDKSLTLNVPPAYAHDKGWFDDVMSVVQVAAPIVLAAL